MKQTILKIKEYIIKFDPQEEKNNILELEIEELVQRVLLFLNIETLPKALHLIMAKAFVNYKKEKLKLENSETGDISSVSDNGQSISYKSKKESILLTEDINNIFNGLEVILLKYKKRKVTIVGEELT